MKRRHEYIDTSFYDQCSELVSSGNYRRVDYSASVPGHIGNGLGESFRFTVVLASTFESIPKYFEAYPDIAPENNRFFLLRTRREDTSHGDYHENTNEKLVWKTNSCNCFCINKEPKDIPDHRVDYTFNDILEASPLRKLKDKPAPRPPNKKGTWKEYDSLCASLDSRELFK